MSNENITREELVSILRFALSVLTKDAKKETSGIMATDDKQNNNEDLRIHTAIWRLPDHVHKLLGYRYLSFVEEICKYKNIKTLKDLSNDKDWKGWNTYIDEKPVNLATTILNCFDL